MYSLHFNTKVTFISTSLKNRKLEIAWLKDWILFDFIQNNKTQKE